MKYNYYVKTDRKTGKQSVICVGSYAGKVVRAVAKCNPNDTFDFEKGKALAAARCDEKIALKRLKHTTNKVMALRESLMRAQEYLNKQEDYLLQMNERYNTACMNRDTLEDDLNAPKN
jgi:Mg2+ and Co2+ transporter CorA